MLGKVLGPYRIDRQIGSGGMGSVHAATVVGRAPDLPEGARVALKVVHPHLLDSPGFFKRFLREAELGRRVRHPNVVRTFDADALRVDGEQMNFLVMEYVEGQTLRELVVELERVPEELCCQVGRDVARGLGAIHAAGAVHRDLKPENVLLTRDNVVKIMDLGVARIAAEALRLSRTGNFVGSVHYAAPEQFRDGGRRVDGRADLHALGLLLYELASGTNPYFARELTEVLRRVLREVPRRLGEVDPSLSPFFEEVVHRLLAKEPADRFPSARELETVLHERERSEWWRGRDRVIRAAARRPVRRPRVPRETAVHGREEALAALRDFFDRAAAGEGRVAILCGEPGIGRSRLVDEFVRRLEEDGEDLDFLFGVYPPGGAATASGAISSAFRERLGEEGSAGFLPQTPILVPAFDAFLRGEPAAEGTEPLTKESFQTCFVQVMRAVARDRAAVVFVDDLHFAPEEGRALFAALAMAAPGQRVLLIGSLRSGAAAEWQAGLERLEHVRRIELERLEEGDVVGILSEVFESAGFAATLAERLHRKSDGNPYFLFEILRELRQGGFVARSEAGAWRLTRALDDLGIPACVLDLVQARVAGLDEDERDLLDVASCYGFRFDPALIGEVLGLSRIPALKRFGQIERRRRLVRAAGREMVFDHHQDQEAVYGSLHLQLREEYHLAIAEALARRAGEEGAGERPDGAAAVDLFVHFVRGGAGARALGFLDAALDHLESRYLNVRALQVAEMALEVPGLVRGERRVDLLLRRADRLGLVGRPAEARAALDEALPIADSLGDRGASARVLRMLGRHLSRIGRNDEAREVLERAVALAREAGDRSTEALATANLGNVHLAQGRLEPAREHYALCLAHARADRDRRSEALAVGNLGLVFRAQGRLSEAAEHFERSLALSREIGDLAGVAGATMNLGNVRLDQGRHGEARERFEQALAASRAIGHRKFETIATGNLGLVFLYQGDWDRAHSHFERHLDLSREIGHRQGESDATGNLGGVEYSRGRLARAREHYDRQRTLAAGIGDRWGAALAISNLGVVARLLGDPDGGGLGLREALDLARAGGLREIESWALYNLGRLAADRGDPEEALRLHREALALRQAAGQQGMEAASRLAIAEIHLARGERDAAAAEIERARASAAGTGEPGSPVLAACLAARLPGGDATGAEAILAGRGDAIEFEGRLQAHFHLWRATGSAVHLDAARRLLDFLVEHAPPECRDAARSKVPSHRVISEE